MLSAFAEGPIDATDAFMWYDNRTLNSLLDRKLLFSAWRRNNRHSGKVGITQAGMEALREAGKRVRVLKAAREFAAYVERQRR
jgi:hypothetical protein